MRSHNTLLAATLLALGLVVWFGSEGPRRWAASADPDDDGGDPPVNEGSGLDESSGGSALPCAVPLGWRVVRVDGDFGIDTSAVDEALRKAIAEWEEAAGRTLFAHDPDGGSPVRLIYGERQARSEERRRLVDQMESIGDDLARRRTELERRTERGSVSMLQHEQRSRDLQARVSDHNELVRRWNERGGAPPDVMRRVRAAGTALDQESQVLRAEAEGLDEMRRQIEADRATFDEDAAEYNRLAADIDARLPPTRVESGVYREAIRVERGRAASASREIRIYRFTDQEDLVRVLAHELGHSLGLGHVEVTGALMSEEYGPSDTRARGRIRREDVDALVARCPGLFEG